MIVCVKRESGAESSAHHRKRGQDMDMIFRPIGFIRSPYDEIKETPKWGDESGDTEAELILEPRYEEGLADVSPGDRLTVVFCFNRSEGYELTVHIRGTGPLTGLFSTHSPRRPNPIGVSVITVKSMDGNRLVFTGVDMLDGTPVLDIKSYSTD